MGAISRESYGYLRSPLLLLLVIAVPKHFFPTSTTHKNSEQLSLTYDFLRQRFFRQVRTHVSAVHCVECESRQQWRG